MPDEFCVPAGVGVDVVVDGTRFSFDVVVVVVVLPHVACLVEWNDSDSALVVVVECLCWAAVGCRWVLL